MKEQDARRWGTAIAGVVNRLFADFAAEIDRSTKHGRAAGLSEDETREVIRTWRDRPGWQETPDGWRAVRFAMDRRAAGLEWRP